MTKFNFTKTQMKLFIIEYIKDQYSIKEFLSDFDCFIGVSEGCCDIKTISDRDLKMKILQTKYIIFNFNRIF